MTREFHNTTATRAHDKSINQTIKKLNRKNSDLRKICVSLVFLIFCSVSFVEYCEGQWIWQNITPQSNPIGTFCLTGENSLIACGYPNTIIKSTNGGSSWVNLSNYTNNGYFYKYSYFLNENTGWIETDGSSPGVRIFKTTDGGKSWLLAGINDDFSVRLMEFVNDTTGYSFRGGRVIKTTNGGTNWNTTNFPSNNIQWTGLDFADVNTGWAAGYLTFPYPSANYIAKTTNGGLNWTTYEPGYFGSGLIKNIKFVNSQTGWYSGDSGFVRKTTNGGINWFNQSLVQNKVSDKLCFYDDQNGWIMALSPDSLIFRTTNGGQDWISTNIPIYGFHSGLKFVNQNTGYIFGGKNSRQIIKTTNGGQDWFFLSSGIFKEISAVHFSDATYGWAVGGGFNYLKTTNGGDNWNLEDIPGEYFLNDVYFKDQQTGWMLTTNKILKTINSGLNWITLYDTAQTGSTLGKSFYIKNENEIFVPRGYSIFKSTNGGTSWFHQYINNGSFWISEINFFSESNGWLISNLDFSSKVFKTTNGGQTWVENFNAATKIVEVYFLNTNTGWLTAIRDDITSFRNMIYKTTNGGTNWISYDLSETGNTLFGKMYFENENTGIVIGGKYLNKTTNGGINWSSYCILTEGFTSMCFLNPNTGWLCGTEGSILKTTTGSSVWIKRSITQIPKDFKLEQNYPNPFNPSTVINYKLSTASDVVIKIYDLRGRELETLVNGRMQAGTYSITFNGAGLSSGVYFYRMTANGFSETKKMHLIK